MKKGFYYSVDAIVALMMILTLIVVISYTPQDENSIRHLPVLSEDLLSSLSTVKVSQSDNPLLMQKLAADEITNREQDLSILGYIAELWSQNRTDEAQQIFANITSGLPINGMELSIENDIIYENGIQKRDTVVSSSRVITGVSENRTEKGISARSYLTGIGNKVTSDFVFFGGFVGQGNITKLGLDMPSDANITGLQFEADLQSDAIISINGIYCMNLDKNNYELGSKEYDMSSCIHLLEKGKNNYFRIVFTGNISNSYIGGGIIEATYTTDEMIDTNITQEKYEFPGIRGIINLYSSINTNYDINNMEAYLHVDINHSSINNATFFLNIGNYTAYSNDSLNGEHFINLDSDDMSMIEYDELGSTIPIRTGFHNLSYTANKITGNADVVIITDLSGSMDRCVDSNDACSTGCPGSSCRMDLAKDITKSFASDLLNISGNRISLVTYSYDADTDLQLTNDTSSVNSTIDSFSPGGATCVGCALREARKVIETQSDDARKSYIILMTDGIGNMRTYPYDQDRVTCCSTGYCSYPSCGRDIYYSSSCSDYLDDTAKSGSINDACYAHEQTNATIHSVGFGAGSIGCDYAVDFLEQIASCGNGTKYSSSNMSGLYSIYSDLASSIIESSTISQSIAIDSSNITTTLYNDSYIRFNVDYRENDTEGKISMRKKTEKFGSCNPSFSIGDIDVTKAYVTSFSSKHWTDRLDVNSKNVFDLSSYNRNYTELGDPFIITVPEIISDSENIFSINIGDTPTNSSGCSYDSRLVYDMLVDTSHKMEEVYLKAQGCTWNVTYFDGTTDQIKVPEEYFGTRTCTMESYDDEDAIDVTTYELLKKLDIDNDGRIDIKFDENNFEIETIQINEIPDLIGPSRLVIRTW